MNCACVLAGCLLKTTEVDGAGEIDFSCALDSGFDAGERVLRCSRLGKFGKAPPKKIFHFNSSVTSRSRHSRNPKSRCEGES